MIQVVCVKHGNLYGAEYVNKLYRGVARHTTLPFRFICFTEDPTDIIPEVRIKPFLNELPGWWNKLYLFSHQAALPGRIFYLDLDTVITGNIDPYMQFSGTFAILRDFYAFRNDKLNNHFGSGLMSWEGGWGEHIWKDFMVNPRLNQRSHGHGDQGWLMKTVPLTEVTFWQDIMEPNKTIDSYKVSVRANSEILGPTTSILCFHGEPRPHKIRELNWMQEHWV